MIFGEISRGMATYIHYERFCSSCKRYYEGKLKECPKCNGAVKNVNKWYVTFRAEEFGQNKQKKLGAFHTKNEAELAYMQYSVGDKTPTSSYTFEMLATEIVERQKLDRKAGSYLQKKNVYFNRLAPFLKIKLKDIGEKELLKIKAHIKSLNYASGTEETTWSALGYALKYASLKKDFDKPYKAFLSIKPLTVEKKKKDAWTIEEWKKFNDTVYNQFLQSKNSCGKPWQQDKVTCTHYMYYVFFNYLANMGNRKGEATAVRVEKIDFDKNIITIDESASYKLFPEDRKKGMLYKVTSRKNDKVLVETMPKKLAVLLKEYIENLQLKPKDFLFYKERPLPAQTLRDRMDYYISLAGVKRITPHQFRHTLASIVFSTGGNKIEDAYVVANRLGHNVKYTLDTYGSLFKEREEEILNNLDL